MTPDLTATRTRLLGGGVRAIDALAPCLEAARSDANRHTFIATSFERAEATARSVDLQRAAGAPLPPLAGLAVSIKDLFDVQGEVTAAASRVLANDPPAVLDAPAVARLRRAGAAFVGRTNMTEFAYSGVGLNPHHGTPPNGGTAGLDGTPRVPGGSTSGGGVSVATGAAFAALGSDTGGSIRIPAALQGLVGFKNTARLTPTEGAVPLSSTLDTACAITRSVRDAVLLHEILADRQVVLAGQPLATRRLAVPRQVMLDGLDHTVAAAFERSLARLRAAGAHIETIDLPELGEMAGLQASGGFTAAESWAWHRHRLARDAASYDPRVASRIRRGEAISAADYIDLQAARTDWIARVEQRLHACDALLSPTVPCVPPPIGRLAEDDAAFFALNALLLRNPSVVNLLDGCALSLPCHAAGELPVGLMVWGPALRDDTVLDVSMAVEAALAAPAG